MTERKGVFWLIMIMTTACLAVAGVTMSILYKTALKQERARLSVTAQSQARLIEAVARFNEVYSKNYPGGAKLATLSQIIDAHENYKGFGRTGEFTLSEKIGNNIVFLLDHHYHGVKKVDPVPFESPLAEPMRRALSGNSGTVIGPDYQGDMVLAAYEPMTELGLGIVAKIDISEVREPFVKSGLIGLCFTVLVVLIGIRLFVRITNPMIWQMEKRALELKKMNHMMTSEISERKQTEELLRNSEAELTVRNKIADAFLKLSDEDVCPNVLKVIMEAMGSDKGYFGYINEEGSLVCPAMTRDIWDQCMVPEKTIVFERHIWGGMWGRSLLEKKTLYTNDPLSVPEGHIPLNRALAVPIIVQDEVVGQIVVANKETDYDRKDINLLETIANYIGPVLKARLQMNVLEGKRQQAEEDLQKANDELEQRVEARTFELAEANEKLKTEIEIRRQTEAMLQQKENMLQTVFDGISDPLIVLDENLRVKILNDAALKYYQKEKTGVINRCCYKAFREKSKPCDGCRIPEAILKRQSITFERTSPKDNDRLEQVIIYQVDKKNTQNKGAIIRIHDITETRLMEREMIHAEKLASLGLMVSCISHEITNPISSITFNAPILEDYIKAMLSIIDDYAKDHQDFELLRTPYPEFRKDAHKILTNINQGSKRVGTIVSNLKKISTRKDEPKKQPINLKHVIETTVALLRPEINRYVKSLEINIAKDLPEIYTAPDSVEQILINLLTNAAHASDKEDSHIKLDVTIGETWHDHLIIEISDNGCGMDNHTMSKIFNPFFSTKAPDQGTGLGLYVCQNLIQKLGGRIEARSEIGKGSVFRVILPEFDRRSAKRL